MHTRVAADSEGGGAAASDEVGGRAASCGACVVGVADRSHAAGAGLGLGEHRASAGAAICEVIGPRAAAASAAAA